MPLFNEMTHRVAQQPEFILRSLQGYATSFALELASLLHPAVASVVDALAAPSSPFSHLVLSVEDDFTKRLMAVLRRVQKEGVKQSLVLGIHRSDYMLDDPDNLLPQVLSGAASKDALQKVGLLQVEMNRISCAFPALAQFTSNLHRYLVAHHALPFYNDWRACPNNTSLDRVAFGLFRAWQLFGNPTCVSFFLPWFPFSN